MAPSIVKLENTIQDYAWGSRHALAELQGRRAPTERPEAELWVGDHPVAPSRALTPDGAVPLPTWILTEGPAEVLGFARSGDSHERLPFLAKILAAAEPLSVQVHPDAAQAAEGFAREQRAGLALAGRCYRDARAKTEVLIALSRFEALCGFRPDAEVTALLGATGSAVAHALYAEVSAQGRRVDGTAASALFHRLQKLSAADAKQLVDEVRSDQTGRSAMSREETYWIERLCRAHPEDPLVLAPILLNYVVLEPGDALAVTPGTVHTYLEGTGVEIMTPSDNVIRAGLTLKHVDRLELRRVTRDQAAPPRRFGPTAASDREWRYPAEIDDLDVAVVEVREADATPLEREGGRVAVVLAVAGRAELSHGAQGAVLAAGEAALVPACVERYALRAIAGTSRLFVVSSG